MTEVVVDVQRNHYRITAKEHADDPTVCAGVSALLYMMGGCIENHERVKKNIFRMEPGDVEFDFVSCETKLLEDVKAMLIGLKQIQLGYPRNIKIKENIF